VQHRAAEWDPPGDSYQTESYWNARCLAARGAPPGNVGKVSGIKCARHLTVRVRCKAAWKPVAPGALGFVPGDGAAAAWC